MRFNEFITEAANPAQQAAIAVNMKKHHQKPKGVAEGLSKRDQQDVAAIRAAIERLQAQLSQPGADQAAIQASIAHEKKRLALYKQGVAEGYIPSNPFNVDDFKRHMNGIADKVMGRAPTNKYQVGQTVKYQMEPAQAGGSGVGKITRVSKSGDHYEIDGSKIVNHYEIKGVEQGVAEAGYPEVDHMPGPTIKRTQTGCKRCHGKGYVYKTPDGETHPMNRPDAKKYKCGKCDGIGFVKQGVAEAEIDRLGMKDGRPYSDPYRRHPGNSSYMTPDYLIQKYKERLAQIAAGPYKRPKEVAQLQSRIAKLEKQGVAEGENWSKHNHKRVGGMSDKSVKSYRRSHPGSKIQTAVTKKPSKIKKGSKDAKRRASFCARMRGMKKHNTSAKTAHDPDSNINKSLRRWHCESVEQLQELVMIAEQKIRNLKK